MNANVKRILSLVMAVLMVASLLASGLCALFGNVFTKRITDESDFGTIYTGGRYTSTLAIDEVKVGGAALMSLLSDLRYVRLVMKRQEYEVEIAELSEKIAKESLSLNPSQSAIDQYKASRDEVIKELDALLEGYTEEDFDKLNEKLTDKGFINSIGLGFMIFTGFGMGEKGGREAVLDYKDREDVSIPLALILSSTNTEYNTNTPTYVSVIAMVFGLAMLYVVAIVAIIFGIVLIINSITKIVKLIKGIKDADEKLVDSLKSTVPFAGASVGLILFAFIKCFEGSAISIGVAFIMMLVAFVIDCLGGLFVKLVNEGFKTEALVRSGMTLVSAILCVVVLVLALSSGIGAVVNDKIESFENVSYREIYNSKLIELYNDTDFSGMNNDEYNKEVNKLKRAASDHTSQYLKETEASVIITSVIGAIISIFATVAALSIVLRLAARTYKTKLGEVRDYGPQIVSVAIVLICTIFVCIFTVSSVDGLNSTLQKGNYKIFVNEYKVEGTVDNRAYTELTEADNAISDAIKELEASIDDISDADEKALAVAMLENLERERGYIKNSIKEIKETAIPTVAIIVLSVLLLACEVAYKVAPERIAALIPALKGKAAVAEVAPVGADEGDTEADADTDAASD